MKPARQRSDGWTPVRQVRFLEVLLLTRSVTMAAGAAGMSRESAHRLRRREPHGLFALAWVRVLSSGDVTITRTELHEGHIRTIRLRSAPRSLVRRNCPRHHELRDLRADGERSSGPLSVVR